MAEEYVAYGIDLGTTNSSIAYADDAGEVRLFRNNDNSDVTPSAVMMSRAGVIHVGLRAHHRLASDPDNVKAEFKRLMGESVALSFAGCGRSLTPVELSAEVLKSLKSDVRRLTDCELDAAVVTVPAAFGSLQC